MVITLDSGEELQGDFSTVVRARIAFVCANLCNFLFIKNERYGNSALDPVRIFSKAASDEQLYNRIDDKLSRIKNSTELRKNDVVDLMGYLALVCVEKEWISFSDLLD